MACSLEREHSRVAGARIAIPEGFPPSLAAGHKHIQWNMLTGIILDLQFVKVETQIEMAGVAILE